MSQTDNASKASASPPVATGSTCQHLPEVTPTSEQTYSINKSTQPQAAALPSQPYYIGVAALRSLGLDWSNSQRLRLEKAGKFVPRVRLSPHRIAYVRAEVIAWIEARAQERKP